MNLHTDLNNLDYIVCGIVLLSGVLALMRGLVRELFSLVAWAGAYGVAAQYYTLAEPSVRRYIHQETLVPQVSGVAVFALAFIVLTVAGALLRHFLIKGHTLTAIDRSLGFLFGLLRGGLVVCIVYLIAMTVLWLELDIGPQPAAAVLDPSAAVPEKKPDSARDDSKGPPAPEWLLTAKTRPFLAYGATELKTLIPKDFLDKKAKQYLDKGKAATQVIKDKQELDDALKAQQDTLEKHDAASKQ